MANVLIFGDSITYGCWDEKGGWAFRLKNSVEKRIITSNFSLDHFVYPLGIPGDTTHTLLQRFKQEADARVVAHEKTVFLFSIGINDSIFNTRTNSFITPLWKFKNNLQALVQAAKRHTKHIIFVGLTPVDERNPELVSWLPECSYKNEYIEEYNKAVKEICGKEEVLLLNIFDDWKNKEYKRWLLDGLHPNSEGHDALFAAISQETMKLLNL